MVEGGKSNMQNGLLSNGINGKNSMVRLQIVPAQPKTITHLPKRPPVDLAFTDLIYKVREGRKNTFACKNLSLTAPDVSVVVKRDKWLQTGFR